MAVTMAARLSRLKLRHFLLLEHLAETRTLRQAGERMHLSHPAVSKMVREIETVFGGELFLRGPRGVRPTRRLERLLQRSRAALGELQAAAEELGDGRPRRTTVRIGANLHLILHLLPDAVGVLRASRPEVALRVFEAPVAKLVGQLRAGELDGVIGRLPELDLEEAAGSDFSAWPIYSGELCVVAGSAHPLARRRRVTLEQLVGQDWALGVADGQSRRLLSQAFMQAGLPVPQPVVECRPFIANMALVARSTLVTVATLAEAQRGQREGSLRILPIDLKLRAPAIMFLCRKSAVGNLALSAVRNAVSDAARRFTRGPR
jgi:DNA-binding transcriptional LysR family regulator